jgi:hypothetical protein
MKITNHDDRTAEVLNSKHETSTQMQLNSLTMTVMHTRECKFHVYLCLLIGFCFTEEVHSGRAGESQEVGEMPYDAQIATSSTRVRVRAHPK